MNVGSAVARSIARSGSHVGHQSIREFEITTQNGNFGIDRVVAPQKLRPGDQFNVEFEVFNGFPTDSLNVADVDHCLSNENPCSSVDIGISPVCYNAEVQPEWSPVAEAIGEHCLAGSTINVTHNVHRLTFFAPTDEGEYDINIRLRHPGSGEIASAETTVEVAPEEQFCSSGSDCPEDTFCNLHGVCVTPTDPDTSPGGGVIGIPGGGNGGGGIISEFRTILILLVILVVLLQASG